MLTTNMPEPESKPQLPPIYREIPAPLQEQMRQIMLNRALSPDATLQMAYNQVRTMLDTILKSHETSPTWRTEDLEKRLPAARWAINCWLPWKLSRNNPGPTRYHPQHHSSQPETKLEELVAHLHVKLGSDPTRFSSPALRIGNAINWLEGRTPAQVLPFDQSGAFQLNGSDDIIHILEAAFGNLDPL
jgi:hypothetical protein